MCTIFTDMDECLVNLSKSVIDEMNQEHGMNFNWKDTDYYWSKTGLPREYFDEVLKRPYIFEMAEPMDGAIENINKLKDYGFEIIFLTCPEYTSEFSMNEKVIWLEKHFKWFNPYNNLILSARKDLVKSEGNYIIDDVLKYLEGFDGIRICFARNWNESFKGLRFETWNEISKYIIELEENDR